MTINLPPKINTLRKKLKSKHRKQLVACIDLTIIDNCFKTEMKNSNKDKQIRKDLCYQAYLSSQAKQWLDSVDDFQ